MSSKKAEPKPPEEPKLQLDAAPVQTIVVQPSPLVPAAPPSPEEMEKLAEAQIKIRKAYVRLVARELRPQDILVFGEEVYIPAKPCRDILSWARIRVKLSPMEEHRYGQGSPDGEYIIFEIMATLTDQNGREVDVIGNRSTHDEFFGIAGKDRVCPECHNQIVWRKFKPEDERDSAFCTTAGCSKNNGRWVRPEEKIHWLPLADVEIGDVRKAAVTNLWNKAIKAIGLAPTLQDLQEAGMKIDQVKRIGFNSNSQKASPPTQKAIPQAQQTNQPSANQSKSPAAPNASSTNSAQPPAFQKETKRINGNIEEYRKGVAANAAKSPYRVLTVRGTAYFLFHNTEMAVNGKEKLRLFDILDGAAPSAQKPLVHFSADSSLKANTNEVRWNITQFFMINRFEWETDGTPVLRRDPPYDSSNMAGAMNPEITDEDVGF